MNPLGCGGKSTCCRSWEVAPRPRWDGSLDEDGAPVVPGATWERIGERVGW